MRWWSNSAARRRVASTAPGYSLAATLGPVAQTVGDKAPLIMLIAFVPILFISYAYVRQKAVEEAVARGDYAPFQTRTGLVFTSLGVLLGIGTIVVILVQPA